MNYLGFDFGKRFIGVAVGQTITKTAQPLGVVMNHSAGPQWHVIHRYIQNWKPAGLVVGIPTHMNGSEQWITQCARDFAHSLRERYDILVCEVDERLSSVEAKQALFDEGGYRALKKEAVDAMAAKFILETWLKDQ